MLPNVFFFNWKGISFNIQYNIVHCNWYIRRFPYYIKFTVEFWVFSKCSPSLSSHWGRSRCMSRTDSTNSGVKISTIWISICSTFPSCTDRKTKHYFRTLAYCLLHWCRQSLLLTFLTKSGKGFHYFPLNTASCQVIGPRILSQLSGER